MAYDEQLGERIREVLAAEPNLVERRMFGGLVFLIGGHMAVAASGWGGLMVRVDPKQGERWLAPGRVEPMEMNGRRMTGWLRVSDEAVATKRALTTWVNRGADTARALPPKKAKPPKPR